MPAARSASPLKTPRRIRYPAPAFPVSDLSDITLIDSVDFVPQALRIPMVVAAY
jgi:hypothetical protein